MSNKSNTASQIVSLPKGGGALHGIGEKFSPDLHTGTGNFTVPIALPPGRNGFQPQLNLVYSTGSGNGPFGLGWSLSVPGVSRKTSKGIPTYDEAKDVFVLSGAEDLVPVPGGPTGAQRYRPRTEGLFALIDHFRSSNDDYWEVRSKDGLVSRYGTKRPSDATGDWKNPAVINKPSDANKIFAWKLTETRDPFGNLIVYDYERDAGHDGPHQWDQLYLKQIRYVDYTNQGQPANTAQFLISVTFLYEDRLKDPFSEYRPGFEIRTRKRCTRIEIRTHAEKERLTRTYDFVYLDQRADIHELESILPLSEVSLLSQIRVVGHDEDQPVEADRTEALPPLEFRYSRFEAENRDFLPIRGRDLPPASLAHSNYELVDLFGNGLPDIFEMNGTVRYWRNLGGGIFDLSREMRDAPAGLALADPDVQLIDADGDGRTDLLVTQNGLSGYFPLRFGGLWDRRSFQRYRAAPSFSLADPEVRLVDLDGDGVTDAVRSGTRLECFFNDPKQGWTETKWIERQSVEFPNVSFSDPRMKLADMSGDGLQDIALVYDGNVEYWPNLGHGNWGKPVHMRDSPRYSFGYDPKRILVGDVDGDGLADIVYVDDTKITLWINQSGNGWSDPLEIDGTPPVSDMDGVRLIDMLGTGTSGVLWSADANGLMRERIFFHDFTGGIKPYLLNEMDNHIGAVTKVEYAPSTRFYLEDEKKIDTRWKTSMPFPVHVVSRVEVIDAISGGKLTTEYRYHHGYWDGAEREFRGFGMVEQLDTETFADYEKSNLHGADSRFEPVKAIHFSPPTLTKSWFHQGPVGDEFGDWQELDRSSEYWSGDPQLLGHTESVSVFLKTLTERRVKRDALRTLRGSILRTELYALDGTERRRRPYTVTESSYGLKEIDSPSDDERERLHIFFPHALAQRTTQWERGDDPMTQFSFTRYTDDQGNFDPFGRPLAQTQVACPRGWRGMNDASDTYLATRSTTIYARPLHPEQHYIHDRVAKAATYEITDNVPRAVIEIRDLLDDHPALRIFGQTLNFYDGDAFTGLPLEQVGAYGALTRTETLVLTEEILAEAYPPADPALTTAQEPPHFAHGDAPAWPGEYPQAFADNFPTADHSDLTRPGFSITPLGYGYSDGVATPEYARGYFVASVRRQFDFQNSAAGKGLLIATRDPLGRDNSIVYDDYDLLPTQVTDPVGLSTLATYDYRVLQPLQATDPNGNRTKYTFTPLGLLKEIFVRGKNATEGDNDRPSARFEYDFLAFENSPPDNRQPIFVRSIRQVHHDTETNVPLPDETIESVEYSDGFGRLVQTRTQAEDTLFGDPVFGDGVLPGDQQAVAATEADVVGRKRAANEPLNVIVSGWQTYDNKSRVVEKYEPFFAVGWDYLSRAEAQLMLDNNTVNLFGHKVTMFYDPRGQVIRTLNPDGSQRQVIYGIPADLTTPDVFAPTPWEAYSYDENDLAPLSRRPDGTSLAAAAPASHHFTPLHILVDALGRTVEAVERNGPNQATDWYITRSTYDIRGNLLTVTDPLGREAFSYVYDLANRPLRNTNIDAGIRRVILDAAGSEIERRDSKRALILHAYDVLNRPIRLWARDDAQSAVTLRERLEYGDGSDAIQPALERDANRAVNRLGKLYHHYDEAGLLTFLSYDFKGNLLEKSRRVIGDDAILSVFDPLPADWQITAFRVDWHATNADELLDPFEYRTTLSYDALNRIKTMLYPEDVDGERKEIRPTYNEAGALESIEMGGALYVERIAYNAKGQRLLIAYGNNRMTRYAYDPQTFRLTRMRTEGCTVDDVTYRLTGSVLQDFAYEYDLAGNILEVRERVPGCGVHDSLLGDDALDRQFTYDPLYRLLSATGRESINIVSPRSWTDDPRDYGPPNQDNAPQLTRTYTPERYEYDAAGNMIALHHQAGNLWTRHFGMGGLTPQAWDEEWRRRLANWNAGIVWDNPRGNQLTHVGDDQPDVPQTHFFDDNGNLIGETTSRHFEWDHSDRMRVFRNQTNGNEPTVHTHYLYDSSGQRVKKLVRKQNGQPVEVTTYIEGVFEHHRTTQGGVRQENNTLHVMDDKQRIALVRVGDPFPGDTTSAVKYHLGDHLGSSNVVIDDRGAFINREEYFPYGETSFGSFARKRYRFTGKERDEESGLNYHEARYYAPWLGRWISCDPIFFEKTLATEDVAPPDDRYHLAIYSAFGCNPGNLVDPDGRDWRTTLIKVAFLLAAGSGNPGAISAVGRRIQELERRRAERQTERRARAIRPREPGDLEGSRRRPPGRVHPRVQPEPVRPSQAPRPTPRESLPRGFPRRPQGLPGSGQGGSATVGSMVSIVRGIGWYLIIKELEGGARIIVEAGTSRDLELRAQHSDIFPLSPEQRAQLRQQRLEAEFEAQTGLTIEESREGFEQSRNEDARSRRRDRGERPSVRGTSVERARELMILRNRPAELRPDPG